MSIRTPVSALGATYAVVGILGFAVGGFHDLTSEDGAALVIFRVTPVSNVIHLAVGAMLMRAALASEPQVRRAAILAGLVLVALGALGPASSGVLATRTGETALHLSTGVTALFLAALSGRATARSRPGPGDT